MFVLAVLNTNGHARRLAPDNGHEPTCSPLTQYRASPPAQLHAIMPASARTRASTHACELARSVSGALWCGVFFAMPCGPAARTARLMRCGAASSRTSTHALKAALPFADLRLDLWVPSGKLLRFARDYDDGLAHAAADDSADNANAVPNRGADGGALASRMSRGPRAWAHSRSWVAHASTKQ